MRFALIGDSHTQVLWPLVSLALKRAGHDVVLSRAQPGWSAASYQKEGKLPGQLASARPDVVVFNVGNNNQDRDAGRYSARVAWAVDAARAAGAQQVIWLGPTHAARPDVAAYHDATAAMEPGIVTQAGASWMDSRPYTQTGHVDGVHFGKSTYKAWAAEIASRLLLSPPVAAAAAERESSSSSGTVAAPARRKRPTSPAWGVLALLGLVGVGLVLWNRD